MAYEKKPVRKAAVKKVVDTNLVYEFTPGESVPEDTITVRFEGEFTVSGDDEDAWGTSRTALDNAREYVSGMADEGWTADNNIRIVSLKATKV